MDQEQQIIQAVFDEGIQAEKANDYATAAKAYNRILNRVPHNEDILCRMAHAYGQLGCNGLAINLLRQALSAQEPKDHRLLNDLGTLYRKENFIDMAKRCYELSIEVGGEDSCNTSNMGGLYSDGGAPDKALHWLEKAYALDPTNPNTNTMLGFAHLTLRNWAKGWDHYTFRRKLPNWDNRNSVLAPQWDYRPVDRLYIHGEQGVGDELMFASVIPDILHVAKHITLEVNPRVSNIMRQTWPQFTIIEKEKAGTYDAKCALADLSQHYRRDSESFPGKPFIKPDPMRVEFYRTKLRKMGPGPYIAVTWYGGSKETRVDRRTFPLERLRPILNAYTCVSTQYVHTNPEVEKERVASGLEVINGDSTGLDLAEQAALLAACDALVTAQQTAVHVAGSVGTPAYVMLSPDPHWRYGMASDMVWYKSVRLFHRKTTWDELAAEVKGALDANTELKRAA